jgi:hypothetical protein
LKLEATPAPARCRPTAAPTSPTRSGSRIERDYLDNISLAGDLAILMRTPRAIVRGDGAY